MIEIARVTMLSGTTIFAARKQYPSTHMYFIEDREGGRRAIIDDVQWAERIREGMADHGDIEAVRPFVERQVSDTHVLEHRLGLKETVVLSALRKTVELATKVG